ncbi:MAG: acyl-CoA thioesterase [Chroococcidiopsidaceae cyanobacterium CP_BM_ER_R8_30]|nr:acyl-CoA thioesterase [Chroococcidiopsidaceae cyanobacterium CP_BM_ER_R8_30]
MVTPFTYSRTIRFRDTDAAGVVYFANVLAICHEAYEESLATSGIDLRSFFNNLSVAIPIIHASVNFLHPMFCGDRILVQLNTKHLDNSKFEIIYQVVAVTEQPIAKVVTRHICIDPNSRTRKELPDNVISWLRRWGD